MRYLAVAIMMGAGAASSALGEAMVATKAMEAMGRNPEVSDSLFPKMIVGMAICESTAIYCLVVAFIMLFVGAQ